MDVTSPRVTTYFDCECSAYLTVSCQTSVPSSCGHCPTSGQGCDVCVRGFAVAANAETCEECNDNSLAGSDDLVNWNGTCFHAISGCLTYASPTVCMTCNSSTVRIGNRCYPQGYRCESYASPTNRTCKKCTQGYTGANCNECSDGFFVYN